MDAYSSKSAKRSDENTHNPRVEEADAVRVSVNVAAVRPHIAVAEKFAEQETDH
jgi:hypothetical protein